MDLLSGYSGGKFNRTLAEKLETQEGSSPSVFLVEDVLGEQLCLPKLGTGRCRITFASPLFFFFVGLIFGSDSWIRYLGLPLPPRPLNSPIWTGPLVLFVLPASTYNDGYLYLLCSLSIQIFLSPLRDTYLSYFVVSDVFASRTRTGPRVIQDFKLSEKRA